mmetsp:Transcript_2638/g.7860  ORF Transcript_2638/g.7860 Transcript_2638/m.7860 type:complete len:227 (-) Transcript_2638:100-780(-)
MLWPELLQGLHRRPPHRLGCVCQAPGQLRPVRMRVGPKLAQALSCSKPDLLLHVLQPRRAAGRGRDAGRLLLPQLLQHLCGGVARLGAGVLQHWPKLLHQLFQCLADDRGSTPDVAHGGVGKRVKHLHLQHRPLCCPPDVRMRVPELVGDGGASNVGPQLCQRLACVVAHLGVSVLEKIRKLCCGASSTDTAKGTGGRLSQQSIRSFQACFQRLASGQAVAAELAQ